nr:hypothetical protein BaRGS_009785 [Batillaria attramentaria]
MTYVWVERKKAEFALGRNDIRLGRTEEAEFAFASSDSYYDYQPQKSVCKKGSPVIKLSGEVKPCNETDDCPMGYECVDSKYGLPIRPDDTDGVCCLEQKKMKTYYYYYYYYYYYLQNRRRVRK